MKALEPIDPPSPIARTSELLFQQQSGEGYWWYTLEANETIGAGFIQLMHFLGEVDESIQKGLCQRILSEQQPKGSWTIFYGGEGDLSTTIECYFSLRLAGYPPSAEPMTKARQFILGQGGLTKARVFTRIHLALFGLVPWSSCPAMPLWFILLPPWLGVSIYEFSSWARASIVPLLLLYEAKPVKEISFDLSELFSEPEGKRRFLFPRHHGFFSLENFFIQTDKLLKLSEKFPWHPGKQRARDKAERWVREHIEQTEDIYPAMAYAAIGLKAIGHPTSDPTIQKAVNGLKRFQQIPPCPPLRKGGEGGFQIHQQCCISPLWDTPWTGIALIESGTDPEDPRLLKAARYLIGKEIRDFRGDWQFKNPKGPAGGWSFEFQNEFFPDVDDTIEILFFLRSVGLPKEETEGPLQRGLAWLLSMQSKNGGWAAFDKNNLSQWVNKIPFADHGACLDPPTPDITGRMIEILTHFSYIKGDPVIQKALRFLYQTQTPEGPWPGRWGVSSIYGTWCVVQGLRAIGEEIHSTPIQKSIQWLQSIQNKEGGWGESCLSDARGKYVPLGVSTASQTAWALMALMAGDGKESLSVRRGIQWLLENQKEDGGWDEPYYTGTGFPGHFYLNYHGYRTYFPLLALGRYSNFPPDP